MAFVVFLALTVAAAAFGALYMPGEWYVALKKPAWTPPNWIFGPVWSALYLMIATAGWLVWRSGHRGRALMFWGANIGFNALWSFLFFGQKAIGLALADIALVWLTIIGFIVTAWPWSRWASLLFVPYLAWVSFASALNFAIWRLNG